MDTNIHLIKWINQELSEILECDVGDEYCKYHTFYYEIFITCS